MSSKTRLLLCFRCPAVLEVRALGGVAHRSATGDTAVRIPVNMLLVDADFFQLQMMG